MTTLYYNIPDIKFVKELVEKKDQGVIKALDMLEQSSSSMFVAIGRLTVHTEALANPACSQQRFWGILKILNNFYINTHNQFYTCYHKVERWSRKDFLLLSCDRHFWHE